ncbi:hypothetical protein [Hydrogenimonas sp.]
MVRIPDTTPLVDLHDGAPLAGKIGGKRVLWHFMTGGCVNCLHLLSILKSVKLPDDVALVTIHTGKFPKEREEGFVREVAARYGIDHPIVNDRDGRLRDAFALKAWPTLVLSDAGGYEVARAVGEGALHTLFGALETRESEPPAGAHFDKIAVDGSRLYIGAGSEVLGCDMTGRVVRRFGGFRDARGVEAAQGRLFVSDREAGEVVAIDPESGDREVLAGGLRSPWGLAWHEGALFVAEAGSHRIVRIGEGVEVYAGLGYEGVREGEALGEALFAQPTDLAWLDGALYVADAEGSALRKVEEGFVATPVGWDLFTYGDRDGVGEAVRLQHLEGLCAGVGGCGNHRIFIADTYNDKIKAFDPLNGRVVTVVEGLCRPTGVVKLGCELFIVDREGLAVLDISLLRLERRDLR